MLLASPFDEHGGFFLQALAARSSWTTWPSCWSSSKSSTSASLSSPARVGSLCWRSSLVALHELYVLMCIVIGSLLVLFFTITLSFVGVLLLVGWTLALVAKLSLIVWGLEVTLRWFPLVHFAVVIYLLHLLPHSSALQLLGWTLALVTLYGPSWCATSW